MTVTDQQLSDYLNAAPSDLTIVKDVRKEAEALVERYIRDYEVPEVIQDRAVKELGAELFAKRSATGGVVNFATGSDAAPIRLARDPMTPVYPLLEPFVTPGIA